MQKSLKVNSAEFSEIECKIIRCNCMLFRFPFLPSSLHFSLYTDTNQLPIKLWFDGDFWPLSFSLNVFSSEIINKSPTDYILVDLPMAFSKFVSFSSAHIFQKTLEARWDSKGHTSIERGVNQNRMSHVRPCIARKRARHVPAGDEIRKYARWNTAKNERQLARRKIPSSAIFNGGPDLPGSLSPSFSPFGLVALFPNRINAIAWTTKLQPKTIGF